MSDLASDAAKSTEADRDVDGVSTAMTLRMILALSIGGGVLMWIVQPPLRWWPLAWVAPIPWVLLVLAPRFDTKRPYRWIYLGGVVHWIIMNEGVRHPHPALYVGWLAMSLFLGLYLPLFVSLSRRLIHHARWAPCLAIPTTWVAVELARGYLATGYSLGLLAHSQANVPSLIQVADFGGAYALSLTMMSVATAIAMWLPMRALCCDDDGAVESPRSSRGRRRSALWASLAGAVLLIGTLGYGAWRLDAPSVEPTLKVALVQGDRDFYYEFNPKLNQEMYLKFRRLSIDAVREHPDLGLVIWPESSLMAQFPEVLVDGALISPDESVTDQEFQAAVEAGTVEHHARLRALSVDVGAGSSESGGGVDMIVGGGVVRLEGEAQRHHNAAFLIDSTGTITARYYKMHPVMFGEYIPGGEQFPGLYAYTPMPAGLSRGEGAVAMRSHSLTISASICFEITVPHLIRQQVAQLRSEGAMPDVLVNPTNDSWFHGASILDLHRDCMVFRAVENGRPVLSAANGGMTVWIDDRGRVQGELTRRTAAVLIAEVRPHFRVTSYQRCGDVLALACFGAMSIGLCCSLLRRKV